MTPDPWEAVTAARLPADAVAALGPVRARSDVRVHRTPDAVWVTWPAGRGEVVRCLLPVPGAEFFTLRDGQWFRFGRRVPTAAGPPAGDGVAVAAALVPARLTPVAPDGRPAEPLPLRIVRGGDPRPVTAVACSLAELAAWAEVAMTAEIEAVRGARAGDRAILLAGGGREPLDSAKQSGGSRPPLARALPALPRAVRYWGGALLVPVGHRPDPDLPAALVRAAAGAASNELVLLDHDGAAVIPADAFEPLTRAGVRLAARGAP